MGREVKLGDCISVVAYLGGYDLTWGSQYLSSTTVEIVRGLLNKPSGTKRELETSSHLLPFPKSDTVEQAALHYTSSHLPSRVPHNQMTSSH